MADDLVPIYLRRFLSESDKEFIDVEDINAGILAESINLSPHRKIGSLCFSGGTSFATLNGVNLSSANLPNPGVGFKLVDFYVFSVDRDSKECMILIFQNSLGTQTKIYINPYYNPSSDFSNYNPNTPDFSVAAEDVWVNKWMELTESVSGEIDDVGLTFDIPSLSGSYPDDYFNGWFVVNTSISDSQISKYNFISDYTTTNRRLSSKTNLTNWVNGDTVKLFRFPVVYLYNAVAPNNVSSPLYSNMGTTFNARPTDFIYKENQLRMPCGKSNRPLVLDMIYKRKYFSDGTGEMKFDGFWFDFQQPQQVLCKSAVSSLPTSITYSETDVFLTPTSDLTDGVATLVGSTANNNYIRFYFDPNLNNLFPITIWITPKDWLNDYNAVAEGYTSFANNRLGLKVFGEPTSRVFEIGINRCIGGGYPTTNPTLQDIMDAFYSTTGYGFVFGLIAEFKTTIPITDPTIRVNRPAGASSWTTKIVVYPSGGTSAAQSEANGNRAATNLFLGTKVTVPTLASVPSETYLTPFIVSVLMDSRNEAIIGHGRMHSNPANDSGHYTNASQVQFTPWFSRKITHIKIYTNETQDTATNGSVIALLFEDNDYPYFKYNKSVKVNETPLLAMYDLSAVSSPIHGEMPTQNFPLKNTTYGINCWAFSALDGVWYLKLEQDYIHINDKGEGIMLVSQLNRFIDEDITMNYTTGCFIGQTNGRFFILGCKNTVEKVAFENDDLILTNSLAIGVSSYDCFSRNTFVNVSIGDKDQNRAIFTYEGFLIVIKDTNVFFVDISTDEDLKFRVVRTQVGRGVNSLRSTCQTPHGIVMTSRDSVYLITPRGNKALLRGDNGRINFYKTYFTTHDISIAYYNEFDELFLVQSSTVDSNENYIMCYSFKYDSWTTYRYNDNNQTGNTLFKQVRTNSSKDVLMCNVKDNYSYNIVKFTENLTTQLNSDGTAQNLRFSFKTHMMSYATKLFDMLWKSIQLNIDYKSSSDRTLRFSIYRSLQSSEILDFILPSSSGLLTEGRIATQLVSPKSAISEVAFQIENRTSSTQALNVFNINSAIIWTTRQKRQLKQGLLS